MRMYSAGAFLVIALVTFCSLPGCSAKPVVSSDSQVVLAQADRDLMKSASEAAKNVANSRKVDPETQKIWDQLSAHPEPTIRNLMSGQLLVAVEYGAISKEDATMKCRELSNQSEYSKELFDNTILDIEKIVVK